MSNVLKVSLQTTIGSLYDRGWSQRRIARELGIDRETVGRYLRLRAKPAISTTGGQDAAESKPAISTTGNVAAGRKSQCEPLAGPILAKVEVGLSAQRIYQDLVEESGFTDSYESVKRFVRKLREAQPERVWRMECRPGEEAQVDFGVGALIDDGQGKRRRSWVFRVVLSYSRKGYSEAVFRQDTETFLRCLENAVRHFGGVPLVLNIDNLKAAVLHADWFDPDLNPKLAEFCRHYGTHTMPCRPATPQHKGKIERGVAYVRQNALKGRRFASISQENLFLRQWEENVADRRIHGTTRKQVMACFEEERAHLQPLPASLFPSYQEARRTVHRDGYVEVAKAYYEMPPEYIGHQVWVRWDSRCVRVFNDHLAQVQMHTRIEAGQVQPGPGRRRLPRPDPCQLPALARAGGAFGRSLRTMGGESHRAARPAGDAFHHGSVQPGAPSLRRHHRSGMPARRGCRALTASRTSGGCLAKTLSRPASPLLKSIRSSAIWALTRTSSASAAANPQSKSSTYEPDHQTPCPTTAPLGTARQH